MSSATLRDDSSAMPSTLISARRDRPVWLGEVGHSVTRSRRAVAQAVTECHQPGPARRYHRGGFSTRTWGPVAAALFLDRPRLLTDGLEIAEVLPPGPALLAEDMLPLASIISAAAGAPWGNVFPRVGHTHATKGSYNGLWATATVDNLPYTLGPPEDLELIPEDFLTRHQGGYVLELRQEGEEASLGLIALQPRLSAGTAQLVETCRHFGVRVELFAHGSPLLARGRAPRRRGGRSRGRSVSGHPPATTGGAHRCLRFGQRRGRAGVCRLWPGHWPDRPATL